MRKIRKQTSEKLRVLEKRRKRVRGKVAGSAERPRLCVTKSNKGLFLQMINDDTGSTVLCLQSPKGKTVNRESAKDLGKQLASQATSKGIKLCVFDRAGRLYHGRIAAVADGAREGGLQF